MDEFGRTPAQIIADTLFLSFISDLNKTAEKILENLEKAGYSIVLIS